MHAANEKFKPKKEQAERDWGILFDLSTGVV